MSGTAKLQRIEKDHDGMSGCLWGDKCERKGKKHWYRIMNIQTMDGGWPVRKGENGSCCPGVIETGLKKWTTNLECATIQLRKCLN